MNHYSPSNDPDPVPGDPGPGRISRLAGLYGPLLLALYFVTTVRWGSYLLPGPPYVGDVALAGLIVHRIWSLWRYGAPKPIVSKWLGGATVLLLLLAFGELLVGPKNVDAIRDAAPYFYAVLVLFGQSYREIPERIAERLVLGALSLLMLFYGAAAAFPEVARQVQVLGGEGIFFLQPRGDVDGAMIAVLAVLALDRIIRGRTIVLSSALLATALVVILGSQSRSVLFAMFGVLGLLLVRYVILARAHHRAKHDPQLARPNPPGLRLNALGAAIVLIAVPAMVYGISGTPEALQRSLNVVKTPDDSLASQDPLAGSRPEGDSTGEGAEGGSDDEKAGETTGEGTSNGRDPTRPVYAPNSGVGTFKARAEAWRSLVSWLHSGPISRAVFGVGFGPHYLQLSGADVLLLGPYADPGVRSAHSFVLNTWSRLGWVGLVLMLMIGISAAVAAVRLAGQEWDVPILDLFAGMIAIAIPTTALVGVVLEAPFGAIPYFWAVGYLGARMVETGAWRGIRLPGAIRS